MRTLDTDILIVGAGLVGSSTAMHLADLGAKGVTVIDLDLEGTFSSSELNAGGVRATWNNPINAELSKISIDYYETVAEEIGFRQKGYFWMFSKEKWGAASAQLKSNPFLQRLGIEYLSPREITARFPFIDKTDDLGGATFSPKDGLLNANLLKMHFRKRARSLGVEFLNRYWVHKVSKRSDGKIELHAWKWPEHMSEEEIKRILSSDNVTGAEDITFIASKLVNCSGAWARKFAQCMGTTCPSSAVRRQVSLFECKGLDLTQFGMFVDSSGVYFHPEAHYILGGYATPNEPSGYNFNYEGESFFEEKIWAPLYERSSKFESLKHITGWAGLYEISPDQSAIVGRVPGFESVYEAHSFSGRGAMQSFGAGLGLAELMLKGRFESLKDLHLLGGERFQTGRTIQEGMLI